MESRGFVSSPSVRSVRSVSTIRGIGKLSPLPTAPPGEKIYVAVKAEVKEGKANLLWAIENVGRDKTVVLAHVLQPAKKIPTLLGKFPVDAVNPEEVKAYRKLEKDKALKNLDDYVAICAQHKVRAAKELIENNDIIGGLVELITQHQITILVMGAAADKQYSKKLKHLKSKIAIGVRERADSSCQILFVCKGNLIFSREASSDTFRSAQSSILSSKSPSSQHSRSSRNNESIASEGNPAQEITKYSFGSQGNVVMPHVAMRSRQIVLGRPHDIWEGTSRSSQSSDQLSSLNDEILNDFSTLSLPKDEESEVGSILIRSVQESEDDLRFASPTHEMDDLDLDSNIYIKLQEALREAESLKNEAYDESCRRRKAEVDALLAIRKAKASETDYQQEVRQRKEIEETLAIEKLEVQKLKEQHDDISEQLKEAIARKQELELVIAESDHTAKDFEDELSKARSLFHSLQIDLDALQQERDAAVKEAKGLRQTRQMVAGTLGDSSEFSILELEQATENFSPLHMIGEGGFGSVYKGFLRTTAVAIKMLHPHSLQGQSEFDQEVSVLSRVRHPNLVTLIGACREASALVYEFLPNGSLEDRLACLNDSAPLAWQVRTRIISEVCSALMFLHSCKPHPVVHGDLKPDNILLDANFVSKLGDFGICHFLDPSKMSTTLHGNTHHGGTFAYIDPEFLTTGEITPHSDVYAFGIVILRLLTRKHELAIAREVRNALDNGSLHAIIDASAGDWPFIQAKQLAHLGLRCSEMGRKNRPTLSEAWRIIEPLTKAASLSASPASFRSVSDDNTRIPSYFLCPIFQEIMKDPQIAGDGFTYEAEAIRGWMDSGHDTSPMTNLKLPHCDLIPNRALRSAIQEWYQRHRP